MSLIDKSGILWIAVFSFVIFPPERVLLRSKRFWTAVVLSVVGIGGVLVFKEGFANQRTIIGILLSIISSAVWAVHVIAVKVGFKKIDSRSAVAVICIYSCLGFGILAALFGNTPDFIGGNLAWRGQVYVIVSAVIGIAICNALYYAAIKRIGATIPSVVVLAAPFLIILFSKPIFNESLNIFQWLFGLMLLAGSALALWSQEHLKSEHKDQ